MKTPDREPDFVLAENQGYVWFDEMIVMWNNNDIKDIALVDDIFIFYGKTKRFMKFIESQDGMKLAYKKYLISKALKEKLNE